MGQNTPCNLSRQEITAEILRLCREDGLNPDEAELAKRLSRYPLTDVERALDAMLRFGAKTVLNNT